MSPFLKQQPKKIISIFNLSWSFGVKTNNLVVFSPSKHVFSSWAAHWITILDDSLTRLLECTLRVNRGSLPVTGIQTCDLPAAPLTKDSGKKKRWSEFGANINPALSHRKEKKKMLQMRKGLFGVAQIKPCDVQRCSSSQMFTTQRTPTHTYTHTLFHFPLCVSWRQVEGQSQTLSAQLSI